MLDTKNFINELIKRGYSHLCVVPCSFAKNLINEAINNQNIEYIACASEMVAASIAAGLKLAKKKPIVIIQSSGLTNMGSCITSLLKPYNITFPIVCSWRTYKSGDSEIQHEHLATALPELIKAYGYDFMLLDQNDLLKATAQIELCDEINKICILQKDTFSKVDLEDKHRIDMRAYPKRSEYLKLLNEQQKDKIFIGTTGNTSREMHSIMTDTKNFYMVGNMGGSLSLGLGVAKSGKEVFVLGGDGEFVMHLGGLVSAGRYKDEINLTYIVFDNEANKSTGGQHTYQRHVNYIALASSCGFDVCKNIIVSLEEFKNEIKKEQKGLRFLHVKCDFNGEFPRPELKSIRVNRL